MASMSSKTGMANGTSNPDYMNSFMSFLETQEGQHTQQSPENIQDGEEVLEEVVVEKNPLEDDVTPTDHNPDDDPLSGSPPPGSPLSGGPSPGSPLSGGPSRVNQNTYEVNNDDPDDPEPILFSDLQEDPCLVLDQETSSEATNGSDAAEGQQTSRKNVARRGRKKSVGSTVKSEASIVPQRESPRRASRTSKSVKRYGQMDLESSDVGGGDSDPDSDYRLSDSDNDPDFNPQKKATNASDDEEDKPRRCRGRGRGVGGNRGMGPSSGRGGRGVKRTLDTSTSNNNNNNSNNNNNQAPSPPKRRGRPPSYQPTILPSQNTSSSSSSSGSGGSSGSSGGGGGGGGDSKTTAATAAMSAATPAGDETTPSGAQDNTVTSTDEKNAPSSSKLSSAYNYAAGRVQQRQTHTIKLPEGPQLTTEQLAMVESQFKSGEFVMAKRDMEMMEHPPIWRIDGKSLLQKFQAFEKDGKTLYRNISTYSGWTPTAKALYVGVRVTFVFQSRYDTVVELKGIKNGEDDDQDKDKPKNNQETTWKPTKKEDNIEISEDLRSHMPSFEIYLQTLISQALDNNFLMEIYAENDDYFVEKVKVIDELAEQRKKKVIEIVTWDEKFKKSLDTWPCINVMVSNNSNKCQACGKEQVSKLSQLYGQPYNQQTLRSCETVPSELEAKNFEVCDRCSNLSQMYNKVTHQKYDFYSQCKSTVTNVRATTPSKHTTTILRDLLANDHWIMGLFRSMCTTWVKVDRLHQEHTTSTQTNDKEHT
ncbi:hypothetical protein Pmani_022145 [Petrolisthes manimaculis]|uniref:DUF4211 domain-containing protein n=1 Tax=Petrolisthes manimaculis TaxID=1843537 RepID=A0AAE1PER1_9EUCA|nr:hypothetical protein Pmani_022145 [Petrolisthes manimaculis]